MEIFVYTLHLAVTRHTTFLEICSTLTMIQTSEDVVCSDRRIYSTISMERTCSYWRSAKARYLVFDQITMTSRFQQCITSDIWSTEINTFDVYVALLAYQLVKRKKGLQQQMLAQVDYMKILQNELEPKMTAKISNYKNWKQRSGYQMQYFSSVLKKKAQRNYAVAIYQLSRRGQNKPIWNSISN